MLYNSVDDSFHKKKPCSRLFQAKCDFRWMFLSPQMDVFEPPLGALR